MDFLKELLELNNEIYLEKIANENKYDEEKKEKFIQKYNKRNNRLFAPCKKYKIDEYQSKIKRYKLLRSDN
tara:strand:- start:456 stop:668 length:213 start_codon:yes stop_codon:yes gene_type:complete